MVDEDETLPPSPIRYRTGSLKSFAPVNDETSIISRGQTLSRLLSSRSRSITNIQSLGDQLTPGRRTSTLFLRPGSDTASLDNLSDLEHGYSHMGYDGDDSAGRRSSLAAAVLNTPQMRSQRLIGNSNPRYRWEQYFKTDEQLKRMKKPIRRYYERNNYLIQQYLYIDRLLDSSLPHNLIQEYNQPSSNSVSVPPTISEVDSPPATPEIAAQKNQESSSSLTSTAASSTIQSTLQPSVKIKRTPKNLYKVPDEATPLLMAQGDAEENSQTVMPNLEPDEETDSSAPVVTWAININLTANTVLLIMKIVVTVLISSVSVLASLVDAALDFLSTGIVWITTRMIARQDQYAYPVGRRRLEPIGILVFSVIMVTSFFQVALEGLNRMTSSGPKEIVQLTIPAIAIMASTVVIKFLCWLWCRLIKNSSVQALAQDAMTDVIFNIFSIIFPLIGFFARQWWLDPLGGIILSLYVIISWSSTSIMHIRNLAGCSATADERNVLLYLTMRFAKTVRQIQGLQAYHAGDKLIVEADVVVGYPVEGEEMGIRGGSKPGMNGSGLAVSGKEMSLRDSHDLGESLQYVLESVPMVDRAFVHLDYETYNLPSHMAQQE
ncbi:hypothetical protein EV356DRAFT_506388 [Viridothelium virens]|uniref:Cation efflux protein transmembrane domain-containing protein n=1 Tax=Viridothelium virens TaxID=1048519 RepID=A0A6A6H1K9_VIRVR|nr:hypothetical protein EV356DRAFT_506388 [Viridothelium virens]